jgi:hypothetical protein
MAASELLWLMKKEHPKLEKSAKINKKHHKKGISL